MKEQKLKNTRSTREKIEDLLLCVPEFFMGIAYRLFLRRWVEGQQDFAQQHLPPEILWPSRRGWNETQPTADLNEQEPGGQVIFDNNATPRPTFPRENRSAGAPPKPSQKEHRHDEE